MKEEEIKYSIGDFETFRARLKEMGFTCIKPREFERNYVLDQASGYLRGKNILFRLREEGAKGILTVKVNPRVEGGMKVRDEYEVKVASPQQLLKMLQLLGYQVVFIYEKYREIWEKDQIHCCLDETPIGNFLEIEGEVEQVQVIEKQLSLPKEKGITLSYGDLFRLSRGKGHMTFS